MAEGDKTPVELFKDFLGNEVRVGDHVVYATTSGRTPVQKFAVVESVVMVEYIQHRREEGQWVTTTKYRLKVGVREISNGRGFERWDTRVYDESKPVGQRSIKNARPARVTYPMPENMVKVKSREQVELEAYPQRIILPMKDRDQR